MYSTVIVPAACCSCFLATLCSRVPFMWRVKVTGSRYRSIRTKQARIPSPCSVPVARLIVVSSTSSVVGCPVDFVKTSAASFSVDLCVTDFGCLRCVQPRIGCAPLKCRRFRVVPLCRNALCHTNSCVCIRLKIDSSFARNLFKLDLNRLSLYLSTGLLRHQFTSTLNSNRFINQKT